MNAEQQNPWPEKVRPADRFLVAQSWWLSSELVRRHPDSTIYEMHPGGGMYDTLAVIPARRPQEGDSRIGINRGGSIQVETYRGSYFADNKVVGSSSLLLEVQDPFDLVRHLEEVARIGVLRKSPASTPRTLVFRFIAASLVTMVNDRHRWDCRNLFLDSSGEDCGIRDYLEHFPLVRDAVSKIRLEGWEWDTPEAHFWALLRDDKPVLMLSVDGRIFLPDGKSLDIMSEYKARQRNLHRLVANILALVPHRRAEQQHHDEEVSDADRAEYLKYLGITEGTPAATALTTAHIKMLKATGL